MDLKKELDLCIRSRFPLICIVSHEEERIVETAQRLCEERGNSLLMWDHADFFQVLAGDGASVPTAKDPLTALDTIDKTSGEVVFALRDFHQCWDKQPRIVRKLRNLAHRLKYTKKTVLITTPVDAVPEELKDDVVLVDFPGPGYGDLGKILQRLLEAPNVRAEIDNDTADRIVRSALGLSSNQAQRVFATLLSWMQEKTRPVFVVATANDVSRLPPELLRRGRIDEIFFLDLPTANERREIFAVHLAKRRRDPARFDLERLAAAAESYVGAEIEQAVVDAMFIAFNDEAEPGREFTTDDVLLALEKLVPMSHSQRENIAGLRTWLTEGRAQSASFREPTRAATRFVPIEVGP